MIASSKALNATSGEVATTPRPCKVRQRASPSLAAPLSPHAQILAEDLIAAGRGDRAAFRRVYAATHKKLFGICLRICGDRAGAEDVLADVYLTVWRRASDWVPGRASPITWIATICRNRAIDWRRARPATRSLPLADAHDVVDPTPDAEFLLLSAEHGHHLIANLQALDVLQRDAIRSAFFDGLTYAALAEREGLALSTVKSRIRRGLAKLKVSLEIE